MKQASSNRTTEEFPAAAAKCGVVRAGRPVVFRWLCVAAEARRDRVPRVYKHEISLGMREMAKQEVRPQEVCIPSPLPASQVAGARGWA